MHVEVNDTCTLASLMHMLITGVVPESILETLPNDPVTAHCVLPMHQYMITSMVAAHQHAAT